MSSTLSVPVSIEVKVVVHEIKGGGFWGEVPLFPGCLAQASTREELDARIRQAIEDWLTEFPEKTEEEARRLAKIQGSRELADDSYPQPYGYLAPPGWSGDDE